MRLELENLPAVKQPDADALRKSLAAVDGFAILSQSEMTYLQTSGSAKDGFIVEYQDGDTDRHYRCPDTLSLAAVTEMFVSYAAGTDAWKTARRWEQIDI